MMEMLNGMDSLTGGGGLSASSGVGGSDTQGFEGLTIGDSTFNFSNPNAKNDYVLYALIGAVAMFYIYKKV